MIAIVVKMMDMSLLEFVYDLALPSILLYVPLYFLKWKDCLDILHGYFWIG
ncbi:hypothetical protein RDI58_000808 [Solanum bulbocastanum]|uniref:Uncharacterized protein n=1 Tax=Solanum bulbocastanum TaxID=147425 RepID=A0AAN8YPG9_SOLBU